METFNYDTCPVCKKGKGRMHKIVADEIEKGNMPKEQFGCSTIGLFININTLKQPIIGARLPAFRVYQDVCEECGAYFSLRQEVGVTKYTGNRNQPFEGLF